MFSYFKILYFQTSSVAISLLLLLCSALNLQAQQVMTLEKAIAIGLENNYQIKIDQANIQIADQNNTWARTGKVPSVDLNGNANLNMISDNNPNSFLNGTYLSGGLGGSLDVNYTIFGGGRVKILKKQLETLADQQRLLQNITINNLIRDIYQAYQEVLLQSERLELLRESYKLSQNRLLYEETRKQFGSGSSFNIAQFEEAILSDSINILNQKQLISLAKQSLYTTLYINSEQDYVFQGILDTQPEELDPTKLRAALKQDNYTLRSLEILQDLSSINTQITETARKPAINFNGSAGLSENYFQLFKEDPTTGEPFKANFGNRANLGVGAGFSWNLYDGKLNKQDIEVAKIQEETAKLDRQKAEAEFDNQIDILISNYNNQKRILSMNDQQLVVIQRNLGMAAERYKAGKISSIDYRNIQNQYLSAAFNRSNSIYNLLLTKSDIDWLIGRIEF